MGRRKGIDLKRLVVPLEPASEWILAVGVLEVPYYDLDRVSPMQ